MRPARTLTHSGRPGRPRPAFHEHPIGSLVADADSYVPGETEARGVAERDTAFAEIAHQGEGVVDLVEEERPAFSCGCADQRREVGPDVSSVSEYARAAWSVRNKW